MTSKKIKELYKEAFEIAMANSIGVVFGGDRERLKQIHKEIKELKLSHINQKEEDK